MQHREEEEGRAEEVVERKDLIVLRARDDWGRGLRFGLVKLGLSGIDYA
jgi:hypothetical protein